MKSKQIILSMALPGILTLYACKKEVIVEQPVREVPEVVENTNPAPENQSSSSQTTTTPQQIQDLPAKTNAFLKEHYANATVVKYEVKTLPGFGKSYEVKLNNGAEIDFDEKGEWHEISDAQGVPQVLVPVSVKNYVDSNYKGILIKSIDKEKNKIKVDLVNDIDLEFDSKGNFIRID